MRILVLSGAIFITTLALPLSASAHPHAWISVRTVVTVNEKGEATSIREHWLFDKMYSTYAAEDFNPNKNGKFTAKDLLPLARQNLANLRDYAYFTVFEDGSGKRVGFRDAQDIASEFEQAPPTEKKKAFIYALPNGQPPDTGASAATRQIAMDFTLPLAAPVSLTAKPVVYRIYDPTYYTDIEHYDQHAVTVIGEKDGKELAACSHKVELPMIDQKMLFSAASLDKNATAPDDLGYTFSEKVTLSCSLPKP